MAREPYSNEDHRLKEILQKANAPTQPQAAKTSGHAIPFVTKASSSSSTAASPFLKAHNEISRSGDFCASYFSLPWAWSYRSLFSVELTQPPNEMAIRPIAVIAVDRAPDIQTADAFTPTGPLTVAPCEPCFEMHAGCAFFRAPRCVEPSNSMAPVKHQDI